MEMLVEFACKNGEQQNEKILIKNTTIKQWNTCGYLIAMEKTEDNKK